MGRARSGGGCPRRVPPVHYPEPYAKCPRLHSCLQPPGEGGAGCSPPDRQRPLRLWPGLGFGPPQTFPVAVRLPARGTGELSWVGECALPLSHLLPPEYFGPTPTHIEQLPSPSPGCNSEPYLPSSKPEGPVAGLPHLSGPHSHGLVATEHFRLPCHVPPLGESSCKGKEKSGSLCISFRAQGTSLVTFAGAL